MCETTEHYHSSGQSVPLGIYQPTSGTSHPAVLIVHGSSGLGPAYRADIESFGHALAAAGIAATLPQYFVAANMKADEDGLTKIGPNYQTWKNACSDALEFMVRDPRFDSTRLGVLGFSLGAHFALSLGMDPPAGASVKAVVDFFGPIRHPPLAQDWSKLPPVSIHHGTKDQLVDINESEYLVAELDAARKQPDRDYFVNWYPNEGHGFKGAALGKSRDATVAFMSSML